MSKRAPGPEKTFQAELVKALHARGYIVEHTYRLRCDDGSWRTGNTLNGKPDLTAIRPPRILAIEVKADSKVRADQLAVLTLYSLIPNARAWVLRPTDDWPTILRWLDTPKDAPRVYGFEPLTQLEAYRIVAPASQRGPR